ncbi:uncharacterized protein G2W53_039862 [Senna tora]|uniref:Uncharacterized protein n=1 Tax=Senna tora TaxID=362788 RepID=A0A834SQM6_9FABA|nr:uncharacterized protein G2W53_039862 [Senna tora]
MTVVDNATRTYAQCIASVRSVVVVSVDLISSSEPLGESLGGSKGYLPPGGPDGELRASQSPPLGDVLVPHVVTAILNALIGWLRLPIRLRGSLFYCVPSRADLFGELTVARQTTEELQNALLVKEAIIFAMLCIGFDHIGLAGLSGVKKEPISPKGPPPGFDLRADKSREDRDNDNGNRDRGCPPQMYMDSFPLVMPKIRSLKCLVEARTFPPVTTRIRS